MISPNVVIKTKEEFEKECQMKFARGYDRGRMESSQPIKPFWAAARLDPIWENSGKKAKVIAILLGSSTGLEYDWGVVIWEGDKNPSLARMSWLMETYSPDYLLPLPAQPKRTCNLHNDCEVADQTAREKGYPNASHCYDETCEECFGN